MLFSVLLDNGVTLCRSAIIESRLAHRWVEVGSVNFLSIAAVEHPVNQTIDEMNIVSGNLLTIYASAVTLHVLTQS